jgi:hypothetical protein
MFGEDAPEQIAQYQKEIVSFFRGFREHVHRFAPEKPIMLAPNCHFMKQAETAWRELMRYCDIVCPFGFHRMPEGDVTGEEVAAWLQICVLMKADICGWIWRYFSSVRKANCTLADRWTHQRSFAFSHF